MIAALRWASALALAYLLPGPVLLHQLGLRRSGTLPTSFAVDGLLTVEGDEARTFAARAGLPLVGERQDEVEIPARLTLSPGRCELRLGPADRPLGVARIDRAGKIQGTGEIPPAATLLASDGCEPFLFRGSEAEGAWSRFLHDHGGDPATVSLTREDGRVAYAIGGRPGVDAAALVVAKDGFAPLRLWLRQGTGSVDVRLGRYRSIFRGGAFPGEIAIDRNGERLITFDAQL